MKNTNRNWLAMFIIGSLITVSMLFLSTHRTSEATEESKEESKEEEHIKKLWEAKLKEERETKEYIKSLREQFSDELLKPKKIELTKDNLGERLDELIKVIKRPIAKEQCPEESQEPYGCDPESGYEDKDVHAALKEMYDKFPTTKEGIKAALLLGQIYEWLVDNYGKHQGLLSEGLRYLEKVEKANIGIPEGKYAAFLRFRMEYKSKNKTIRDKAMERIDELKSIMKNISAEEEEAIKQMDNLLRGGGVKNLEITVYEFEFRYHCRKGDIEKAKELLEGIKLKFPTTKPIEQYNREKSILMWGRCPYGQYVQ